jgi:hypothetical protein
MTRLPDRLRAPFGRQDTYVGGRTIQNHDFGRGSVMRKALAILMLAATGTAGAAAQAGTTTGTLAGQTQISYGCPGPVAANGPSCKPWHAFANARFSVSSPVSGRARTVVSDSQGRFTLRLSPGSYTVRPLPQAHTRGGTTLPVRVSAGAQTLITVRFAGFPMMA